MWFRVNSVAAILFQLHPDNQGNLSRRRAFSSFWSWSFRVLPTASGATVVGSGGFWATQMLCHLVLLTLKRCPLPSHCGLLPALSTLRSGDFMMCSVSRVVTWCPLLRSSVCSRAQDIPEVVCQKHLVLCPRGHGLPPEPQGSALWFSPWDWPQTLCSTFPHHRYLHHHGVYWSNGRRCWWRQPGPAIGVLHAVQCPGPARLSQPSGDTRCPAVSGTRGGEHEILTTSPPHVLRPQKLAEPLPLPCEAGLSLPVSQTRRWRHTEVKRLIQKYSTGWDRTNKSTKQVTQTQQENPLETE